MTRDFWRRLWWRWLFAVALSWVLLEAASIVAAHHAGVTPVEAWTLSDTIRRWSEAERWLAPLTIGTAAGLLWHFFGQKNR